MDSPYIIKLLIYFKYLEVDGYIYTIPEIFKLVMQSKQREEMEEMKEE